MKETASIFGASLHIWLQWWMLEPYAHGDEAEERTEQISYLSLHILLDEDRKT